MKDIVPKSSEIANVYYGDAKLIIPVSFSFMKNEFSALQFRVLVQLLKKLQDDLRKLISLSKRPAIFNSSSNNLMINFDDNSEWTKNPLNKKYELIIRFSDLRKAVNCAKNNNKAFQDSIVAISNLPIKMLIKRDAKSIGEGEGECEFIRYTHLCDVEISQNMRKKVAIFSFEPDVANGFLGVSMGHFYIVEDVINSLSSCMAQKMYMLISQFSKKNFIKISEPKLRLRLGVEDSYQGQDKLRYALSRTKKYLDALFDNDLSDLTYEVKPDEGRNFIIKIIKNIQNREQYEEKVKSSKENVAMWLRKTFTMTDEKKIKKYLSLVTFENINGITDKLQYIYDVVTDPKKSSKIVDKRAYVMSAIDNLFKEIAEIPDVE